MRIQELERLVGIDRATIRYYEKEGLICPVRSENGYRDYSDADARELERIRLLRGLGISLETIRQIRQGSAALGDVMARQIVILEGRQQQMDQARAVCQRIAADGVGYRDLDTAHYQQLLESSALPAPAESKRAAVYAEPIQREVHPWRRFLARILDHEILTVVLWFLVVVVLRWRPAHGILPNLVKYAAWFVLVPLEAVWIHWLGTTPGKWLLGIRTETPGFSEALERSWKAFYIGMGCGIPFLRLYCMYKGYKAHTQNVDTDWDLDTGAEVSFRKFSWVNILLALAVYGCICGLDLFTANDSALPKYRGELTVAQYARNYNDYNRMFHDGGLEQMDPSGILQEPEYDSFHVLPNGEQIKYDPYGQFTFHLTQDGAIDSITFRDTWFDQSWLQIENTAMASPDNWIPMYCQNAIITAIASQGGVNIGTVEAYTDQLAHDLAQPTPLPRTYAYGDIQCTWDLDLEHIASYENGSDLYEVTLDLKIEMG